MVQREILAVLKANKKEQNLQNWKGFAHQLGAHVHLLILMFIGLSMGS